MDKKDKNSLLTLLYMGGLIGLAALFLFLGKQIKNVLLPFGVLLAIQQLYVIPKFVEKYRMLYGYETGFVKFIPVYNETLALSPLYANSYLVLSGLVILSLLGVFIDPNLVAKILPNEAVMNFSNMAIYCFILLVIILSAMRGIGYCKLVYDIQNQNENYTGVETNLWDMTNIVSYVTVFIPGMRVLGLMYQLSTLTKLVDINNYVVGFEEDEEEYDFDDC